MPSIGMFTYSTRPRGSVVHAAGVAEALARAGHDVTLYALGKDGEGFYRPLACDVRVFPAGPAPASKEALVRQRIDELVAAIRAHGARHDLWHAQDCLAASALLEAREGRSPPVVRTVHHVEAFAEPYLADCQRRSIVGADAVLSVSRLTRRDVLAQFGRASGLVPNGVDRARFDDPAADPGATRARLGLSAAGPLVVSIGGVEPRKNSLRALEAAAQALRVHPVLQWVIVGGDSLWDHSAYVRAFDDARAALPAPIAERVRRTGPVADADVAGLLRAADVFFFPSQQEGFGLSVLEAMAAGACVVVPGREPFTEYLDARSAVFIDPERADAMGAALVRLAGDARERAALAAAARAAVSRWSWARSAAVHSAHYRAVLEEKRRCVMASHARGHHPVVVVGGGQAGLSVSHELCHAGVEHLVLERTRVGSSWRDERWDTFCLVTPNWQCQLPGHPYAGPDPEGFMGRDAIVGYLEEYARSFDPPLREGVAVRSVERRGDAGPFVVDTSAGTLTADQVVIATGAYHRPVIPAYAAELPAGVFQVHSAHYRNPAQMPAGDVLVVGTGQSGCQIAEDLHLAGRRVHLAVGSAPRCARRYRGKDVVEWLHRMGYYDIPIDRHPNREQVRDKTNHYVTGRDGGRDIDLRRFASEGMSLYGPLATIEAGVARFAPGLARNLDAADEVYRAINRSIDEYIARESIAAPAGEPYVPCWAPSAEIDALDLARAGVSSVVWCIGFASDFAWVRVPVFDPSGYPRHERGVTDVEGLYFIGLPWLYTWGSGRFSGVGRDARHLATRIRDALRPPARSALGRPELGA